MTIHQTLTDDKGNTYRVVKNWWLQALTAIAILNFIIVLLILAGLIDNVRAVDEALNFKAKTSQRENAINEMIVNRTEIMQRMYLELCELDKEKAEPCQIRNNWWADPARYPLIANDPEHTALFPPRK